MKTADRETEPAQPAQKYMFYDATNGPRSTGDIMINNRETAP
jgi:hypothetical protein